MTNLATSYKPAAAVSSLFPVGLVMVFTTQPSNANAAAAISPSIVVTVRNGAGATFTGFTGNITLALQNNPTGAVLSGTLTVAAVAGVATFSNVRVSLGGSSYTLAASSTGFDNTVSAAFNILGYAGTLTSVQSGDVIGFYTGVGGAISPTAFGVYSVTHLYSGFPGGASGGVLILSGAPNPAQNLFTSITVGGVTKLSADATYGGGTWTWTGATLVASEGSLAVTIAP